MKQYRILLTGGGTGGHIYPLIAIVRELRKQPEDFDIKYFGPKDIFSFYLTGEGVAVKSIISSKLRRYFSWLNFLDVLRFALSSLQSLWRVFWFMPDVVFSKGGPGSLPVLLACHFYRVPIIIHESDSVPGLTNRITARWAKTIFVGFASSADTFKKINPAAEIIVSGNPVRSVILNGMKDLNRFFPSVIASEAGQSPTILVLGGSQGSTRINDFIFQNLDSLLSKYQIIHQVGNANYSDYMISLGKDNKSVIARRSPSATDEAISSASSLRGDKVDEAISSTSSFRAGEIATPSLFGENQKGWARDDKKGYFVIAYLEEKDLADAYATADLVIARAGAETIFELAATGKPSILIPLPESAQDHQRQNAYEYAQTGAALVVEEENLLINLFEQELDIILNNPEKIKQMSVAAKNFYKPEANKKIVDMLQLY